MKYLMESQYQHFIPQFILRKFSNFGELRAEGVPSKKARKYCKVSTFNLESGLFEYNQAARTFGVQDLYRDPNDRSTEEIEVEEALRVVEERAAKILANIETAYNNDETTFTLNRSDKDELRRFLFIMLYRNRTLGDRYEKSKENYDADDKEFMLKYMEEKGFNAPKAVWLANIRAFIDVPLGHGVGSWTATILDKVYPGDALWFIEHLTNTFLSFCCPSSNSPEEFVLTQNAYSIFEGPSEEHQWVEWHVFAPISPHITIVMRRNVIQKVAIPELENRRQTLLKAMLSDLFADPIIPRSSLLDLPLEKPQTNYTWEELQRRPQVQAQLCTDTFTFTFFRLRSDHFQRINSLFLEEALETKGIVFKDRESFKKALEAYFVLDPVRFKQVASNSRLSVQRSDELAFGLEKNDWIRANREKYLKLLENGATKLGSSTKALYFDRNEKLFDWLRVVPAHFSCKYQILGGTMSTLVKDLMQANAITNLVTGTDFLLKGKKPEFKSLVQRNRADLLEALPARWLWCHVRQLRMRVKLLYRDKSWIELFNIYQTDVDGIEDALIDAYRVFDSRRFAKIMYKASLLDLYLYLNPLSDKVIDFQKSPSKDENHRMILFEQNGSIAECGRFISVREDFYLKTAAADISTALLGIPKLEQIARQMRDQIQSEHMMSMNFSAAVASSSLLRLDVQHEVRLRKALYGRFESILGSDLSCSETMSLKSALFGQLYRLNL